ncbi:exported hypothetical protein [Candidatus Sulfotelmatomonas gaucii]|uniref:Uncharacterized protein n=1 Tax=Candidatus Sulfuritelmatomonas gaucii TaxID=2043161 RepID=A0A2N9M350_9BACT|nr:exported hypothetical protein [Candidatus Sulfotelmatomonas gaucii]
MKWSLSTSLTLMFLLAPATMLLSQSQTGSGAQQPQDQPTVASPSQAVEQIATNPAPQSPQSSEQLRQSMRDHFRICDQSLDQARNQAHTLAHDASQLTFDTDALKRQHQQIQEQIRTLKESREQFLGDLNDEQQKSIQDHNQSMQQIHDRIQAHLQMIDQEFTGSNLHLKAVANEAKAAEREMKSYHKHLQETGKTFNLLSD